MTRMRNGSATNISLEHIAKWAGRTGLLKQCIDPARNCPARPLPFLQISPEKRSTMSDRRFAVLLVLAWLFGPVAAQGQHTEEHNVEVIRPPNVKPSKNQKKPDLARVARIIVKLTNDFRKE